MKNKILLIVFSFIISVSIVNIDYGMLQKLRTTWKKRKIYKPNIQFKRPYSSSIKGPQQKGLLAQLIEYLKTSFKVERITPLTPSPIAGLEPLAQQNVTEKDEDKILTPKRISKAQLQITTNGKVLFAKTGESLVKIINELVFGNKEERLEILKKVINIMEDKPWVKDSYYLYKPMELSEFLFTKLSKREGMFNINNLRFSIFCQGDNNENPKDIRFSILNQAINEHKAWNNKTKTYLNDNDLKSAAQKVLDNYIKYKKEFFIPQEKIDQCLSEIVNFIKDISENQVVIAVVEAHKSQIIPSTKKNKKNMSIFLDALDASKIDTANIMLGNQLDVSVKKGRIKEIYNFHKLPNYNEVLKQIINILNKYIMHKEGL